MRTGHFRKRFGEPTTLAVSRAAATRRQAGAEGVSDSLFPGGPGPGDRRTAGLLFPRTPRRLAGQGPASGGEGASCATARPQGRREGVLRSHRGPRAEGRASPPSEGSAGPSRGCRHSGPPGRSRHISLPHPGSPPWLAPGSLSSGRTATTGKPPPPPPRRGQPGWGRAAANGEEHRGPWRRRPGRTGGPRSSASSQRPPRPPLRREPHLLQPWTDLLGLGVPAHVAADRKSRLVQSQGAHHSPPATAAPRGEGWGRGRRHRERRAP